MSERPLAPIIHVVSCAPAYWGVHRLTEQPKIDFYCFPYILIVSVDVTLCSVRARLMLSYVNHVVASSSIFYRGNHIQSLTWTHDGDIIFPIRFVASFRIYDQDTWEVRLNPRQRIQFQVCRLEYLTDDWIS